MYQKSKKKEMKNKFVFSKPILTYLLLSKNQTIDFIKVYMSASSILCVTSPLLLLLLLLSTDITLPRIWKWLVLVTGKLIFGIHGVCGCLLRSVTLGVRCGTATYCLVYIVFISLGWNGTFNRKMRYYKAS